MKRVKININLSNKWFYTFISIGIIIILGVVVYAVAGVSHDASEIEINNVLCNQVTGHNCGYDTDTNTQLTEAQVDTMANNNGYLTSKFIGFTDAECTSAGGSGSTTATINSPYWGSIKICKTRTDTISSGWALIGYHHLAVTAPRAYDYSPYGGGLTMIVPAGLTWQSEPLTSPVTLSGAPACTSSSCPYCTVTARFQEFSGV